jgi:hypothetical protein
MDAMAKPDAQVRRRRGIDPVWTQGRGLRVGECMMNLRRLRIGILAIGLVMPAAALRAQIVQVALTERGRPVPVAMTDDLATLGRTVAHALLATARRDVTRPVSDSDLAALERRGTMLRVRLASPQPVALLRLGARDRASRLAAYVPPGQDHHAFVFLGRSTWSRIVVVDLPGRVRAAIRRLRAKAG